MKIFISHKSDDKMSAYQIRKQLTTIGVDVFLDMYELKVGDSTDKIGIELSDSNAMVVLYSANTEVSDWVRKEVAAGAREKKRIIPFVLDKTLPTKNPYLRDQLYVDFSDPELGLGHLCLSYVIPEILKGAGYPWPEEGREYEAVVSTCIRDLIVEERGLDNAEFWRRTAREEHRKFASVINETVSRINEASSVKGMLTGAIGVVDDMQARLDKLLTMLGRLEDGVEEHRVEQPGDTAQIDEIGVSGGGVRGIESYSGEEAKAEIRGFLDARYDLPGDDLEKRVIDLHYFIERSHHVMNTHVAFADQDDGGPILRATAALLEYLDDPDDLLPEAEWGYIGYLDDAWLINNLAFRVQEAEKFDPDPFPVQWDDLIESDEIARVVLPDDILSRLEDYLVQLVGILFDGDDDYAPRYFLDENRVPRFFMSGLAESGSAARKIESYSDEEAQAEIREYLDEEFRFRGRGLGKRVIDLHYFIERSTHVLAELLEIAEGTDDAVHRSITMLCGYLDDPDDLLPEAEWGYIGYLDDAWLINNFALRVQEEVEFDPDPFPVDWGDLIESDEWVRTLLPEGVLEQLELYLEEFVGVVMS